MDHLLHQQHLLEQQHLLRPQLHQAPQPLPPQLQLQLLLLETLVIKSMNVCHAVCSPLDSESGVTQTIADITGQIATVDNLLADQSLTNEVRTALEAQKILLTELKTQFETLLQEVQKSRMKRETGNCKAQLMT